MHFLQILIFELQKLPRVCRIRVLNLFSIIVYLASSCAPIYYAPNAHNVPLFKEKNDLRVSAHYSIGEDIKAIELQTAYAFDSAFSIQLNGMRTIDNEKAYGAYIDVALGHFKPLPNGWVFEIYAGFGSGKVNWQYGDSYSNNFGLDNPRSRVKFSKFFLQPSIGYAGTNLNFAFSYKIGFLSYNNLLTNIPSDQWMNYDLPLINGSSYLMSEPALTLRLGEELIKLHAQLGYSTNLQNNDFKYNQDNWNLNFGLQFSLNKKTLGL